MSVRYPALGKTRRSAWGLTVKKGPYKESLKDKTYQVNNQSHAGHGDWMTVERPNYNNTQGGDPIQSMPRVVTSGIKYTASEFIPKTRPGRLQRSYLTERQQKQTLTSQPAGLGPPMAEVAQGFRLGGGNGPGQPPSTGPGGDDGPHDLGAPPRGGAFHSEGQHLYPSPVSNYSMANDDRDPDHDPIDDLAPPNQVVDSPWQDTLDTILDNEQHTLVATEDEVMHTADTVADEAAEFEQMSQYIIAQHPRGGDLMGDYLKSVLETDGMDGIRDLYANLIERGGAPGEPAEGVAPTLAGGGVAPEVDEEVGTSTNAGGIPGGTTSAATPGLTDNDKSAMIAQMPSVPETLPTGDLDRIEVLLKTKNPWESAEDVEKILETARLSGEEFQKQLLRHLINQPDPNPIDKDPNIPKPTVPPELDDIDKLRQLVYVKYPDMSKEMVEHQLLVMKMNNMDPDEQIWRILHPPPSPFHMTPPASPTEAPAINPFAQFEGRYRSQASSNTTSTRPSTVGSMAEDEAFGGYRSQDTSNTSTPDSSRRPSTTDSSIIGDAEYYNDPTYSSLVNALDMSIHRRGTKRPRGDEVEVVNKRPRIEDSVVTNSGNESTTSIRPNTSILRPNKKPPRIDTRPTSTRFPPVNYKELSSGESTPKSSATSSDEERERKNAMARARYAKRKANGTLKKRVKK